MCDNLSIFNTALIWLIVVLIILIALLKLMPWGNRLLAVGGSVESAHSRGVRMEGVKLSAFIICGTLAALGDRSLRQWAIRR